jgi:hypothetical protein
MMKNLIIFFGLALFMQGCVTPFSEFYRDQTGGIEITTLPEVVITRGEPKVLHGSNEEEDSLKMLEDGYGLIGYSSFNAGDVDENGAITQAKKVHASVVILYSKYTNTVSGSMPLTLPDTQTSSTSLYGDVYSSGGYASYSGSAYTTTYGTKTTYIPYSVRRYDYMATYWVKFKKPIFGVHVKDLTTKMRQEINSNKGMLVNAVIKGSPAFQADILKDDVLRRIGDVEIYKYESIQKALAKYAGQVVNVIVLRNGKEIEKEIQLNTD